MEAFIDNISGFPTVIYTTALVVVVGYWILAILGTIDLDFFDAAIDADIDIDIDGDASEIGKVAGLLTTLGLTGVPITIVLSLLLLNAWIICYFLSLVVPGFLAGILPVQIVINLAIAVVSFMLSILLTATMIRPLKGLFRKLNQAPKSKSLIGRTCRVRSSRADNSFGEAECQLEGASLIVKIRTIGDETFQTGASVVLTEHQQETDSFVVVSEDKFKQKLD